MKARETASMLVEMHPGRVGRRQQVEVAPLDPGLRQLRAWQAQRLALTHADLLQHPRYRRACEFFLSDIYAPRNLSQRDHDLETVYNTIGSVMPPSMVDTLRQLVALNTLTGKLDDLLLAVLVNDLGMTDRLTAAMYAEAYRRCDNYEQRKQQIELIVGVGKGVEYLVHRPLVGTTLRLARKPAEWAGWADLQDFLERGFAAFKQMERAEAFLRTIELREMHILDRIYERDPDPFRGDVPPE